MPDIAILLLETFVRIWGIAGFLVVLTGIMVALPWISRFLEQARIANPETTDKIQLLAENPLASD